MDAPRVAEALRLLKDVAGCFESHHITTFRCYRNDKDGQVREVAVEIMDAGPDAGELRYHLRAIDDLGRRAIGNPAGDLDTVFRIFHWFELDMDR